MTSTQVVEKSATIICNIYLKTSCWSASSLSPCWTVGVHLLDGFPPNEGRVELHRLKVSGIKICASDFGHNEAAVICRMLKLPPPTKIFSTAKFGEGEGVGRFVLSGLKCNGTEESIDDCKHDGWDTNTCSINQAVGVVCGERVKAGSFFSWRFPGV